MFVNTIGPQFDVVGVVAHFFLLLVDSIIRRAKVGAGEEENYKGVVADSLLVQCPAAKIGQKTEGGLVGGGDMVQNICCTIGKNHNKRILFRGCFQK